LSLDFSVCRVIGGGATATNSNKSKAIRLNHTEQMVAVHQKAESIDVKNVHVNSDIGSCNDGLIMQQSQRNKRRRQTSNESNSEQSAGSAKKNAQ